MTDYDVGELVDFLVESNKIEGITRELLPRELDAAEKFLALDEPSTGALQELVAAFQPGAKLRSVPGRDVIVGSHRPPPGGEGVLAELETILHRAHHGEKWGRTPYKTHVVYEILHPFMDGNGRSGRMLWAWQMLHEKRWPGLKLGFLHAFYYQTLEAQRR